MPINGEHTIVREADGIHLNEAGAELLADELLARIERRLRVRSRTLIRLGGALGSPG